MTPDVNASRVALITGGAGVLGFGAALRLSGLGYPVAIADLSQEASDAAAARLPGAARLGVAMDASDEESVRKGFDAVEAALGPVTVLVTVAGGLVNGASGGQSSIFEVTLAEWEKSLKMNATSTFLCIREFARRRASHPVENGRVITVSSSAGQLGGYQARSAYVASKGAVMSLTKVAARELAPMGITVNSVSPGAFASPLLQVAQGKDAKEGTYNAMSVIPLGRVGQPHEFAVAVEYLASVDSSYSTGSFVDVNGGIRVQ